ncbi:imidazole glycerol phosphate synthase subunit HisF [Gordonibacter sp. 28C]|uniref:AglZ/HisF2 family acetamidino modification protein n=1 Tax=Gordonibacter sp. 28C TaxID=2078569 RepID=UPI000DF82085|nr:AglZ/HisF2 family acetamidino modification protein [Gordonibacter sp. 28C]RDB62814.1 imidazole glycerol phosphate synthase subunit HisF [Gordonibacter sp. 28C]
MLVRPRLIPCLSIIDHDLVKTVQFDKPRYLGDPVNAVKIFNEKGIDELCVLDIRASRNHRAPDMGYLADIASEAFMPLSYGGGITSLDEIERILFMGYEKVVINTAFVNNPRLVGEAAGRVGSQSVVVAIDAKSGLFGKCSCFVCDGGVKTGRDPVAMARLAESCGAGEILLNSISNDGMMHGYDLDLISSVAKAVSIPVIACGGAKDVGDFRRALDAGAHAAAAGSLYVYYGKEKAVLINAPEERRLFEVGIYR